jgi:hypothetical protein
MILRNVYQDPSQTLTISISAGLDTIVSRLLAEGPHRTVNIEDVITRAHFEGAAAAKNEAIALKSVHGSGMRFSVTRSEKD